MPEVSFGSSVATEVSREFWAGLAEGRLRLQRCITCGMHQTFPQRHCRGCLSQELEWVEASGNGTLHSFSTVHRPPSPEFADKVPYVLGMVRLDDGVQLLGLIDVADESELALDVAVRAKVDTEHGGQPLLAFVPASRSAA